MLAEHLSRSFLVDWQPLPGCNCAWDRLFSSESKTLSEELQEDPDPSVLAAAELLHAWDEVVVLVLPVANLTAKNSGERCGALRPSTENATEQG